MDGEQTLARTIWAENRGGGVRGMQSIANVVINRAAARWMGDDNVVAVCLHHDDKGVYQFSCWSPNDVNYAQLINPSLKGQGFQSALYIANTALMGRLIDITDGATNYHAKGILPYWAKGKTPCAEVAGHLFYRNA